MPTTQQESEKVVEIAGRYMDPTLLPSMFHDLLIEVALPSENYSVRGSIIQMVRMFNPDYVIPDSWITKLNAQYRSSEAFGTMNFETYCYG